MKILIIPTVREIYKKQFEFCVDLRLLNFLEKIFKKPSIEIYNDTIKLDYDLIVFAGGNNSIAKNSADKVRNKINHFIYDSFFKKRINILGICHGAHFLAKKNGLILGKKKNHIGSHKVIFKIYKNSFKKVVNSYHNEIIKFKKIDKINIFGIAEDNTVEAFHIKNMKILGIMWHPERYSKLNSFDKKLIKEFYATNSIVGW
jgi:N5-(cytidine 5'-diphosphoramidyl)-L-glutamine hydrolase